MSEMNKSVEMSTRDDGKEWRYSVENNGITKTCTVKEVENGYTIRITKWGRPDDDKDAEYTDDSKEFISTVNPLTAENLEESISDAETLGNIQTMKSAFSNFNY